MKVKERIEEQAERHADSIWPLRPLRVDGEFGKLYKVGHIETLRGFTEGAHFGFQLAIEMLKSEEADRDEDDYLKSYHDLMSAKEWANWLEEKLKE